MSENVFKIVINTLIGNIELIEKNGFLIHCNPSEKPAKKCKTTVTLQKTIDQLHDYFSGKRKQFDLPIALTGTVFQKSVWNALTKIPYGETWSYQQLATAINHPCAYRAVGSANGKNPISIIIPCHRVIRARGDLGGYASGIDKKRQLLQLENAFQN